MFIQSYIVVTIVINVGTFTLYVHDYGLYALGKNILSLPQRNSDLLSKFLN